LALPLLLIAAVYFSNHRLPQGSKEVTQRKSGNQPTFPDDGTNIPEAGSKVVTGAANQTNSPTQKETPKNDSSNGLVTDKKTPSKPGRPEPQFWSTQIITEPPGAKVIVDDTEIGQTPCSLEKKQRGKIHYRLSLLGYKTVEESRTIGPGEPATWTIVLQKQAWTNSLGMEFVLVGGVWVSIWETRVRDFHKYVLDRGRSAGSVAGRVSLIKHEDYPATMVTLQQARDFCAWLSQMEFSRRPRPSYRLPTDREWSTAVGLVPENGVSPRLRGEQYANVYPWGDQWPPRRAGNYASFENRILGEKGYKDGYPELAPVGSFPPNSQGIYDLGGNVWEWCDEEYDRDAKEPATRGFYVLRGASWREFQRAILRSNYRLPSAPDSTQENVGFRCVMVFEPGFHTQSR